MQRVNIDEIIQNTESKIIDLKYGKIDNKPSFEGIEITEEDFLATYVFKNNIFDRGCLNISKNVIVGKKEVEVKGEKIKKKIDKYLDDFYSKKIDFIDTIKNTFIKEFIKEVKFCPYCGKVPLIYFGELDKFYDKNEDNKRTFELDHFFAKSDYKDIAFNFYNLIPSCKSCNHLKSNNGPLDTLKNGGKIFHPYFGWLYQCKSGYIHIEDNNFDSEFNFVGEAGMHSLQQEHSQFFKLPQIYLNSQDTFNTFAFIQDKRNKMKAEKNHYAKKSGKTEVELKNYFFKNYAPETEDEILNFANGKLKKDLIENLKI